MRHSSLHRSNARSGITELINGLETKGRLQRVNPYLLADLCEKLSLLPAALSLNERTTKNQILKSI
jgi:hypothetical protein